MLRVVLGRRTHVEGECQVSKAIVATSAECDICQKDLLSGSRFYDARVPGGTAWAWLCQRCFARLGAMLGVGRGQEYDSKTRKKIRG
jgi:hypothetical protein